MGNMIVDLLYYDSELYDIETAKHMYDVYCEAFPGHVPLMLPKGVEVFRDMPLDMLKSVRTFLNEIIEDKEREVIEE